MHLDPKNQPELLAYIHLLSKYGAFTSDDLLRMTNTANLLLKMEEFVSRYLLDLGEPSFLTDDSQLMKQDIDLLLACLENEKNHPETPAIIEKLKTIKRDLVIIGDNDSVTYQEAFNKVSVQQTPSFNM